MTNGIKKSKLNLPASKLPPPKPKPKPGEDFRTSLHWRVFRILFELITLIQTKKISEKIPVVLVGTDYWGHIDNCLKNVLYQEYKTIDKEDFLIYKIVDTAEEAFELIKDAPPREDWYY